LKDAFLLHFSRLFADATDVPVSIAVSNLTDDDETRKENDIELSKIPTPASQAFSVATPEANSVRTFDVDPYADNASAEMQLNAAWLRLSGWQRDQLRQEERFWIRKKDAILPITRRTEEVRARTRDLLSFVNN
jgi:hypothetical protein